MSHSKALVGAATRFIAGRNAVQTVYWRSKESSADSKMIKVSKTLHFDRNVVKTKNAKPAVNLK